MRARSIAVTFPTPWTPTRALHRAATLVVTDLDLDTETARVVVKGHRVRGVSFGNKTLHALDRYLRARARHKYADSDRVGLGRAGPLASSGGGIKPIVRRRTA